MSAKIEIKDGKFIISGELQPPERSKTGKKFIVFSTHGFMQIIGGDNKTYSINVNIITDKKD